eukprot:SAG22_NODE_3753_length_1545_cov_1.250346_1_plen_264_part_00
MGCLPSKTAETEEMSMRLSQSTPRDEDDDEGEEDGYGDTELKLEATKNFSSNVNDLFGDMMADMKTSLKEDTMLKLGGKNKDKWESRRIELTSVGVQWKKEGAKTKLGGKDLSEVGVADITGVRVSAFDENLVRSSPSKPPACIERTRRPAGPPAGPPARAGPGPPAPWAPSRDISLIGMGGPPSPSPSLLLTSLVRAGQYNVPCRLRVVDVGEERQDVQFSRDESGGRRRLDRCYNQARRGQRPKHGCARRHRAERAGSAVG